MKAYSLALIFNNSLENVLLIEKQRPDWQKGRLNGVGGKLEIGETSLQSIVREVDEETGLHITPDEWVPVATMQGSDWFVDVFTHVYSGSMSDIEIKTDEMVSWFCITDLPQHALSNIPWLVHLSLDKIMCNEFNQCIVSYA